MGILGNFGCLRGVCLPARTVLATSLLALTLCAGCHRVQPVDLAPLESAGMAYDSLTQLRALHVTAAEVPQLIQARQAGFSDAACVQVLSLYRTRKETFDAGQTIANLLAAGATEDLVVKLARLNQLGLGSGELEAMRLAGLSDDILLTVAQRHAANQPVLSGASLAGMKNLGLRTQTLLVLAQRGIPDSEAPAIMSMRRHGAKDDVILRQFSGS
jgi:hypothetical protein